jgi:hypothetical protein
MALFTDAGVVTLDDLQVYENSLVSVASSHGINVDTKISLSLSAIGDRMMQWLFGVGASDPQWMTRRQLGLSTVVVTPSVRRWISFDALARFFAEAYNTQLNTRFQGKWTEYQNQASDAARLMFSAGLGIVHQALPKPALPLVSVQDGTLQAQSIFIQTAWVDASGNESALSPVNGQVLSGAASVAVAMAEGALNVPASAVGWNLYASAAQTGLTRQNTTALSIGSAWAIPAGGLIQGAQPQDGQLPAYYIALSRQILRG